MQLTNEINADAMEKTTYIKEKPGSNKNRITKYLNIFFKFS